MIKTDLTILDVSVINLYCISQFTFDFVVLCPRAGNENTQKLRKINRNKKQSTALFPLRRPGRWTPNYLGIRCCIWSERSITYLSKLILNFLSVRPHLNRISTQSCKTRGENKNCSKYQEVQTQQISGDSSECGEKRK